MNTQTSETIRSLLWAACVAVILFAAPFAQADPDGATAKDAPGVADMLLRRHETQLRAQFVLEGRLDDVRKLDETKAQRLEAQHEKDYDRANAGLARSVRSDGPPFDARALVCDPDTTRAR